MASASSSMPSRASSSTQTRSASCAPLHAVDTMARSNLRLGRKIPGVSTRMIWALFSITMPRIRARVVCTLRETIVTLDPTSALTSVDLPTLGAPISATKPQRVAAGAASPEDSTIIAAADAFARDHHGGCNLFGGALAAADAFGRRQPRQIHGDAELRIVMRSGALDLAINRRRQSLALRPFLQHGLGIAQRPPRLVHPLGPVALDEQRRGIIAAVKKYRPDHRFADVAEYGFAQAGACTCPDRAKLDIIQQPERPAHVGATFLAHEFGQPFRQFAFVSTREGAIKHVGHDQPEHVIAEEFETLVTVTALARRFQRGNVGEGGGEQRSVGKFVPDPRFDRSRGRLGADLALLLGLRGLPAGVRLRASFAWWRRGPDVRCFVVHRTIVNRRYQRTAVGQRQNIQACSPSAIEKKIIWARPTIFSNGT